MSISPCVVVPRIPLWFLDSLSLCDHALHASSIWTSMLPSGFSMHINASQIMHETPLSSGTGCRFGMEGHTTYQPLTMLWKKAIVANNVALKMKAIILHYNTCQYTPIVLASNSPPGRNIIDTTRGVYGPSVRLGHMIIYITCNGA